MAQKRDLVVTEREQAQAEYDDAVMRLHQAERDISAARERIEKTVLADPHGLTARLRALDPSGAHIETEAALRIEALEHSLAQEQARNVSNVATAGRRIAEATEVINGLRRKQMATEVLDNIADIIQNYKDFPPKTDWEQQVERLALRVHSLQDQ